METGQIIHIVITAMAILGAGAVALVCDMLKTNNERLRQANMELRLRREEEQRRTEQAVEQLRQLTGLTIQQALPPAAPLTLPETAGGRPATPLLADPASPEAPPRRHRRLEGKTAPLLPQIAGLSGDHVGKTLEEARAVARNLLQANAAGGPAPRASGDDGEAARNNRASATPARRNWDLLLKNAPRSAPTFAVAAVPATPKQRGELIPFESLHSNQDTLPPGLHRAGALRHLLDSRAPFRGMVMAIGVNGWNDRPVSDPMAETLNHAVTEYLSALLEPSEFACQPGADRFVLVSQDRDGAAQRRFAALAGKLSDFQLKRSTTTALFSYSGFEANGEPLCEAVASALDLMQANRAQSAPAVLGTSRRRKVV
jgi:hypothetical protein